LLLLFFSFAANRDATTTIGHLPERGSSELTARSGA